MRFGSVCSGIEAASVAWGPLGWEASWFAEIEPFPSAVLAHHYPHVPNLGDMTTIARRVLSGEVEAPDLLCGGTPCQAFSVAGLRKSLDDDRGNLTLKFVELADAIDHVRARAGLDPADVFWENVPGVLSTKDNAFGCFLAGLAGEDEPLVSPRPPDAQGRRTWSNAGCVYGPKRAIAWRTLDAQYFGLAQRRRRVFVVASARNGFDPATVLFEWDGVRRDTPPSRQAGKDSAICPTLRAGGNSTGGDRPPGTDVDTADSLQVVTHSLRGEGFDASEDGTGRGTPLVPVCIHADAVGRSGDAVTPSPDAEGRVRLRNPGMGMIEDGTAYNLMASGQPHAVVAFDTTQVTSATNRSNPQPGDPCHPLAAGAHPPAIAFQAGNLARGAGSPPNTEVFPTLKADHGRGLSDQHPCVAFPANLSGTQCDASGPLTTSADRSRGAPLAVSAYDILGTPASEVAKETDVHTPLRARTPGQFENSTVTMAVTAMQVRRLTPRECEALQGFPQDYTAIPWRKKPASECPDGPRYKALGNSWATHVVNWLGRRLAKAKRMEMAA